MPERPLAGALHAAGHGLTAAGAGAGRPKARQNRAAQRLKLAALGRLTANIAHEIRNPLSAISHAAQLLREESHDATQAKLTGIIENNARRLDRLVEEVLTLNRRDRLNPTSTIIQRLPR